MGGQPGRDQVEGGQELGEVVVGWVEEDLRLGLL